MHNLSTEDINFFKDNGYLILDLGESDLYDTIIKKSDQLGEDFPIIEGKSIKGNKTNIIWKKIPEMAKLGTHKLIESALEQVTGKKPKLQQTMTFKKRSNVCIHSDCMYAHTDPPGHLAAAWVALEDVDEANGCLYVYPGSHKLPELTLINTGIVKRPPALWNILYQKRLERLVEKNNYKKTLLPVKRGQVIIWAGNLLHGGVNNTEQEADTIPKNTELPQLDDIREFGAPAPEPDPKIKQTRWSQANHYFLYGADKYYFPNDIHGSEYFELPSLDYDLDHIFKIQHFTTHEKKHALDALKGVESDDLWGIPFYKLYHNLSSVENSLNVADLILESWWRVKIGLDNYKTANKKLYKIDLKHACTNIDTIHGDLRENTITTLEAGILDDTRTACNCILLLYKNVSKSDVENRELIYTIWCRYRYMADRFMKNCPKQFKNHVDTYPAETRND